MKQTWYLAFGLAVATLCTPLVAGQAQTAQVMLEAARKAETIDGNPKAAIAQYEQIVKRFAGDRAVVADALVRMAGAYRQLGDSQATAIYQRVVKEFSDQAEATAAARAALGNVGGPARRDAGLSKRRLWSGPEVDTTGRVTPDGRFLTFTDWQTGDLAIRDLAAGTSRRLTNKGSWAQSSAYAEASVVSPDGQSVAYGWYDGKDEYAVRIVGLQGTAPPRRLYGDGEGSWVVPVDWSRVTSNGIARDIFVADMASGREHRVAEGKGHNAPVAWTSDGLLYASATSASMVLWLQRMQNGVADGRPALVTNDAGAEALGVTNDGGLVLGTGARGADLFLAEVDLGTGDLRGQPIRPLDGFMSTAMQPTWSRDGSALAYLSPRSPSGRNAVLGIRDSATGRVRELQPALMRFFFPRWMPDGQAVIVQGMTQDARQGLFSINAGTGDVTTVLLAGEGEQLAMPQPSPDGKFLYFGRLGKSGRTVVARDLATGTERELAAPAGAIGLELSPDGSWLALVVRDAAANRSSVVVMRPSGGEVREVFSVAPAIGLTNFVSWSSDGRHLLVMKDIDVPMPGRETMLVPLDGGAPRTIQIPKGVGGPLAVHPDGKRVAFTTRESRSEVWILENFLPPVSKAARE